MVWAALLIRFDANRGRLRYAFSPIRPPRGYVAAVRGVGPRLWLLLLAALALPAAAGAADAPSGSLTFAAEAHNFGDQRQHADLSARIAITNVGRATLRRIRPLADCGCYDASVSASTLAPGARAEVLIRFRTLTFTGRLRKKLRLAYDEGSGARTARHSVLPLEVNVVAGVILSPGRLHLGELSGQEKPTAKLRAVWYEGAGEPFEIRDVVVAGETVKVTKEPFKSPRDRRWQGWAITLSFDKPFPRGMVRREVTLHTTSPSQARVTLPLTAHVVGKVWLPTTEVSLGFVPSGTVRRTSLTVRAARPDIRIKRILAVSRGQRISAELRPSESVPGPGAPPVPTWTLHLELPATASPGLVEDLVEIRSDVLGDEHLTLRVRAIVY